MRDTLLIEDSLPRPPLVASEHPVAHASFPVIDAHKHIPMYEGRRANLDEFVRKVDLANRRAIASLSGGEDDDHLFGPAPKGAASWRWWKIYGVYLPDDVLNRVTYDNAAALLKL